GDENGLSGYAGGGLGVARVKYAFDAANLPPYGAVSFSDSDSRLAWQAILGARYAVTPNFDIGLKYRLFNVARLRYNDTLGTIPAPVCFLVQTPLPHDRPEHLTRPSLTAIGKAELVRRKLWRRAIPAVDVRQVGQFPILNLRRNVRQVDRHALRRLNPNFRFASWRERILAEQPPAEPLGILNPHAAVAEVALRLGKQ